jgi:hypothetical protein
MRRRRRHRSLGLAGDGWMPGLEAATVVGLRGQARDRDVACIRGPFLCENGWRE